MVFGQLGESAGWCRGVPGRAGSTPVPGLLWSRGCLGEGVDVAVCAGDCVGEGPAVEDA